MTGPERREQLIEIGRTLFAERGIDGATVEELASRASVSKPVVYEHFSGKEDLYAVVVEREVKTLLEDVRRALARGQRPREMLESACLAVLDYVEHDSDGFRILVRDSPVDHSTGSFVTMINDIASQVEDVLAVELESRGFDPATAPVYAQMLVGMVAMTGQWWLDERKLTKREVAAHLVNLAWNGLSGLDPRAGAGHPR